MHSKRLLNFIWSIFLLSGISLSLIACGGSEPDQPATADGTANKVLKGLQNNKPRTAWDALPPSYQKDVTDLVHLFANKTDAELYNRAFSLSGKLVTILKDKKAFILGSPMMAQAKIQAQAQNTDLEKDWDSLTGLLEIIVNSELNSIEQLKKLDVGKFLDTTGNKLMLYYTELAKMAPAQKQPPSLENIEKISLVSSEGNNATIKTLYKDGKAEETQMLKVEERWIPADMASNWKPQMDKAQKTIAELSPEKMAKDKVQAMMVMGSIEAVMDQLAAAKTQDEFNAAIGGLMMGMMSMGNKGAPGMPPGIAPTTK